MSADKVEIAREEYERLLNTEAHMDELDARGVDNWVGYVGNSFYCDSCDHETPWREMETSDTCPKCGHEDSGW